MENNTIGEFGMVVVNPDYRGKRLGSGLVEEAEKWAKSWGAHTMRLELLTPKTWKQDTKEFMKQWYTRIGYKPQKTEPFEKQYPIDSKKLATECDFTIWLKPFK